MIGIKLDGNYAPDPRLMLKLVRKDLKCPIQDPLKTKTIPPPNVILDDIYRGINLFALS